jgi:Yip1 domain
MTHFLPSLRVIYRPDSVWQDVHAVPPRWYASLLVQVLPFSLLCAVAWPRVSTVVVSLAAVALLGLGFFVLAPWFEVARSWDRSLAVAAYATTPVFLSWVLLLYPPLMVLPIVALLHCFALCYLGVQRVLGCRESEAAMLVASAWVFGFIAAMFAGGLCSAAGLI